MATGNHAHVQRRHLRGWGTPQGGSQAPFLRSTGASSGMLRWGSPVGSHLSLLGVRAAWKQPESYTGGGDGVGRAADAVEHCVRNTVSHMHRAQAKKRRSWELTGARHCSQQVHTMRELGLQLHFTDAETENQRWQVTCLWSHSEPVPQSFNLGSLIPGSDIAMGAPDVGSEAMNPPRSS